MEQPDDAPPTPALVKAYIKIRDAREALAAKFKEEDDTLKAQLEAIEVHLQEACKRAGGNISLPGVGTVIRGIQTRYSTTDWEAMHKFVKEHDNLDLLERRIAQRAMADFMKANPDLLPQGMNVESKYTITVRRK